MSFVLSGYVYNFPVKIHDEKYAKKYITKQRFSVHSIAHF